MLPPTRTGRALPAGGAGWTGTSPPPSRNRPPSAPSAGPTSWSTTRACRGRVDRGLDDRGLPDDDRYRRRRDVLPGQGGPPPFRESAGRLVFLGSVAGEYPGRERRLRRVDVVNPWVRPEPYGPDRRRRSAVRRRPRRGPQGVRPGLRRARRPGLGRGRDLRARGGRRRHRVRGEPIPLDGHRDRRLPAGRVRDVLSGGGSDFGGHQRGRRERPRSTRG